MISCWLFLASAAKAQRPAGEEVARQQLIERAQTAHQSGAHRDALDLAQRASQIRKTPTLLLFIAEEQEEIGALADAYAMAYQCAHEAELDPEAKLREKTIERCRSMAERLRGKVSYVVVNVPNPPQGFSVRLSGQQLNHAAIGVPYVITPGKVTVEASAPGRVPYRLEIDVPEAKTVNVTVSLAPEATATACPGDQQPDGSGRCVNGACRIGMVPTADGLNCCWPGQSWDEGSRSCTGVPRCPTGTEPSGNSCVALTEQGPAPRSAESAVPAHGYFKPYALGVAAVGGAALVTGGVIWLIANGRFDDLKNQCNDAAGCTPEYRLGKVDDIIGLDKWAMGFAIGGGVAIATAAVLQWAVSPQSEEQHAHLAIDPLNRTLILGGRF